MAMNKKEKQLLLDYQTKSSLHLSTGEKPKPDVAPPTSFINLSTGYLYNAYVGRVDVACSCSVYHATGRTDKTTTQGCRWLYSTEELALKAMRFEMELTFASQLRAVDLEIEKFNN